MICDWKSGLPTGYLSSMGEEWCLYGMRMKHSDVAVGLSQGRRSGESVFEDQISRQWFWADNGCVTRREGGLLG
jgi:hypothetical protein